MDDQGLAALEAQIEEVREEVAPSSKGPRFESAIDTALAIYKVTGVLLALIQEFRKDTSPDEEDEVDELDDDPIGV
jgi:hypothetical protein